MTNHDLVRHWRKLTGKTRLNGTDAYVHPDDMEVLRDCKHDFNLDYPPPAYVGDIVNAPVVMLLTNGGYSDGTQSEFAKQGDEDRYLECLHDPSLMRPEGYSQYYRKQNYRDLLKKGKLAIVNVVAYRSSGFTYANQKIADIMSSAKRHRQWLREELLPEAKSGKCFVVAHRHRHWKLDPEKDRQHNLIFPKGRRNPNMEHESRGQVDEFLASLKSSTSKPRC